MDATLTIHPDTGEIEVAFPYAPEINALLQEAWGKGTWRRSTTTRTWFVALSRFDLTLNLLRRAGLTVTVAKAKAKQPKPKAKAKQPKSPKAKPRASRPSQESMDALLREAYERGYREGAKTTPSPPGRATVGQSNTNPWTGVLSSLPKDLRDQLYRQAAVALHPDKWPDPALKAAAEKAMADLNAARGG